MKIARLALSSLFALLLMGCGAMDVVERIFVSVPANNAILSSKSCPVTQPPQPAFVAPPPNHATAPSEFWYGTNTLWTALPTSGLWNQLPHNPEGYTQKIFWWRDGYSWKDEPQPALTVTGKRLDRDAPPLNVSRATNAFAEDIQSAMLVGVDFPTTGCWKITGRYSGSELSFVIKVED